MKHSEQIVFLRDWQFYNILNQHISILKTLFIFMTLNKILNLKTWCKLFLLHEDRACDKRNFN